MIAPRIRPRASDLGPGEASWRSDRRRVRDTAHWDRQRQRQQQARQVQPWEDDAEANVGGSSSDQRSRSGREDVKQEHDDARGSGSRSSSGARGEWRRR